MNPMIELHPIGCRECLTRPGEPCHTGTGRARGHHSIREQDQATLARNRAGEPAPLVSCPYCEAKAGEHCRTAMGTINREGNPHSVRVSLARRVAQLAGDPTQVRLL